MNGRYVYLMLAIALGISFPIVPANAQPQGSWQASCPGFSVDPKSPFRNSLSGVQLV
jgi:hypothetical protein